MPCIWFNLDIQNFVYTKIRRQYFKHVSSNYFSIVSQFNSIVLDFHIACHKQEKQNSNIYKFNISLKKRKCLYWIQNTNRKFVKCNMMKMKIFYKQTFIYGCFFFDTLANIWQYIHKWLEIFSLFFKSIDYIRNSPWVH